MTNETARDLLAMIEVISPNELRVNSWWGSFAKDYKEALQMAIKALEQVDKIYKISQIKSAEDLDGMNWEEMVIGLLKTVADEG